jgi:hypothetical protein
MKGRVTVTLCKSSIIAHLLLPIMMEPERVWLQNVSKLAFQGEIWLKMVLVPFPIGISALTSYG